MSVLRDCAARGLQTAWVVNAAHFVPSRAHLKASFRPRRLLLNYGDIPARREDWQAAGDDGRGNGAPRPVAEDAHVWASPMRVTRLGAKDLTVSAKR